MAFDWLAAGNCLEAQAPRICSWHYQLVGYGLGLDGICCSSPWEKKWPPWLLTVSSRWPKWSQPAVTEPWPGPWLSCDLAVTEPWSPWLSCDLAVTELWPRRDWAVTSPWLSCDVAVTELWPRRDSAVTSPWLSCDLAVTQLWPRRDSAVTSPWLSCDLA